MRFMEKAHVWAALALPNNSSCLAVTASLGWLSIESHIDIKRLSYVHRLICAEPCSIARKLTVHVFIQIYINKDISTYEGPITVLYKTCKKYNLMDIVYNELSFSATPMSSTLWKKCVYNSVSQQQIARWNMSRIMYTSLYLFNTCVKSVSCLWIWKVAKRNQAFLSKCKTVARILIGSGCIFYSFSCDNVRQLQLCCQCDSYDRLTVAHVLLSCASLDPLRSVSWATATQSMPGPLLSPFSPLGIWWSRRVQQYGGMESPSRRKYL